MEQNLLYAVPVCGALALLFAFIRSSWIRRQDAGTDEMAKIAARLSASYVAGGCTGLTPNFTSVM